MFFVKGVDESPDAVPDPALLNSCDIERWPSKEMVLWVMIDDT